MSESNKIKEIYLPASEIHIREFRNWITKTVKFNDFIGFDTETYKGACKLLADSEGRYIYNPNFKDCIDFLWYKASQGLYRTFWNLDFDISAILKLYDDIDKIIELLEGNEIEYRDFTLTYLRPKFFQIRKGHKTLSFTDLFFIYKSSLEYASETFLNQHKIDTIDGNLLNTNLLYWVNNLDDIIKYCIQDCKLTAELGRFLLKKLEEAKLPNPRYFSSTASLSKQYFRLNCRIPSIKYIPTNILDISCFCYFGGRFEVLKRGYFPELWNYDINSAYPRTIEDLPDLKYGTWFKVEEGSKKEKIGYYKVLLDIPESYISALPMKNKGLIIFPHGVFEKWITWYEYDLLKDYIIDLYYGYEYDFNEDKGYYPFRKEIDYLYSKKQENKGINEVFYWIYKIYMNSFYGCMWEKHKNPEGLIVAGILFNPIYASIITARTRWQLLKDVGKKNWKNIVAFHTDSVISTKPLKNLKINEELGNWSLENKDGKAEEGVIISSGIYQIGSKIRRRGFSKKDINWFNELKEFQDKVKIRLPKLHVIKIAEALRRWYSTEKVNIFIEDYKDLDINNDKKRNWSRNFTSCKDLLENNISSKTLGFRYIQDKGLE